MNFMLKIVRIVGQCVGWLLIDPFCVLVSNRTDFFDYRRLLKFRFFGCPFMIKENSWYGHSRAIKNFGGSDLLLRGVCWAFCCGWLLMVVCLVNGYLKRISILLNPLLRSSSSKNSLALDCASARMLDFKLLSVLMASSPARVIWSYSCWV